MAVAAVLDPEIFDADALSVALGPKEVGAAFCRRDDVLVPNLRHDPLLFAPDAAPIRPDARHPTIIECLDPGCAAPRLERLKIMAHLEEAATVRAFVNHLVDRPLARAPFNTAESRMIRRHAPEYRASRAPIHRQSDRGEGTGRLEPHASAKSMLSLRAQFDGKKA